MNLLTKLATSAVTACVIFAAPVRAANDSLIELTYSNSQIQCGADSPQLNIAVDVYHNGTLIAQDLNKGESILVPSLDGLSMDYEATNGTCLTTPTELHLTHNDSIPDLPGAYNQDSIVSLLSGLNDYEDLYLVELGTTSSTSSAYDLQDVVFIVNNNPVVVPDNSVSNFAD